MASDGSGPGQQYAIRAWGHTTTLYRARLGITIEVWWCPAHKGIAGNEEADRWAKIGAGKPDTCEVKNLVLLLRSLANTKRKISDKKWMEARQWAGGQTSKKKYCMPNSQKLDGTVANSSKRITLRFYQVKMGYYLMGQYLN